MLHTKGLMQGVMYCIPCRPLSRDGDLNLDTGLE